MSIPKRMPGPSKGSRKTTVTKQSAGENIRVSYWVSFPHSTIKKGLTRKLHSLCKWQYIVAMRIGDMTYRNQATDNSRKQKVVRFNDLKLCSVPYEIDHQQENEPWVHALLKAQPLFVRNCVGIQAHHCNCGYVIVTLFTTEDTPYIIFYVNHI